MLVQCGAICCMWFHYVSILRSLQRVFRASMTAHWTCPMRSLEASELIHVIIDHPVRRHRNRNRICQEVEELQQLLLAGGWPLSKVPEHQALPRHAQLITRGHSIWISMYLIVISQSFPWISYIRKVKKRGFFVTSLSTAAFQIQLPGL